MTNAEITTWHIIMRNGLLWTLHNNKNDKVAKSIKEVLELYPKLEGRKDPVFECEASH